MACLCKRQSNQVNKAYSLFCSKKMEIILIIPACDKGNFGRLCTPYPREDSVTNVEAGVLQNAVIRIATM